MVGQVSLLSSANMTFQERSRICSKKPNCFKLLSELVQTPGLQVDRPEKCYPMAYNCRNNCHLLQTEKSKILVTSEIIHILLLVSFFQLPYCPDWCEVWGSTNGGRLETWQVRWGGTSNGIYGDFSVRGEMLGRSNGASVWKYPTISVTPTGWILTVAHSSIISFDMDLFDMQN